MTKVQLTIPQIQASLSRASIPDVLTLLRDVAHCRVGTFQQRAAKLIIDELEKRILVGDPGDSCQH